MAKRLLLALAAAVATLALLEAALWAIDPLPPPPRRLMHRFLPNYHAMAPAPRVIEFDPGPLPDVTPGVRQWQVNRWGFFYPEDKRRRAAPDELRIATIGGSTVECSTLPQDRTWPALVEQLLARELPGRPVTVLNLGLSAMGIRTHLATTSQLVTGLDVDLVVFMLGANDLGRASAGDEPLLSPDSFYEAPSLSRQLRAWWHGTQIGRHLAAFRERTERTPRTTPYFQEQADRLAALPELPEPLRLSDEALAAYGRDLVTLAGICREHGIAVLFTTQPTMLTATPTAAERATIWGHESDGHRVAPANFVALLDALNQQLLATCRARDYACIDLATMLPKGLSCFFDPVHFTETGARRVAELLLPQVRELAGARPVRR